MENRQVVVKFETTAVTISYCEDSPKPQGFDRGGPSNLHFVNCKCHRLVVLHPQLDSCGLFFIWRYVSR